MIKAVFFDIDGTLVSFKSHRVPDDTRRAMELAAAGGVRLFAATGRHPKEAERVLAGYPLDGFVTLNGQYCYIGGEIIRRLAIDRGDLMALTRRLAHDPYPCEFVEESRFYLNMVNEDVRTLHDTVDLEVPPVEDITGVFNREILQIVAFFDVSREAEEMSVLPHCEATRWNPCFTDIIPKGGSKRAGIEAMLNRFGIAPDEIMAFGDGGNDIPMLQYAGTGIAMGNASEAVKEAADAVTGSVDEGGIYSALKRYGII